MRPKRPLRAFRDAIGIKRDDLAREVHRGSSSLEKYEADLPDDLIAALEAYARSIGREDAIPLLHLDGVTASANGDTVRRPQKILVKTRESAGEIAMLADTMAAALQALVSAGRADEARRLVDLAGAMAEYESGSANARAVSGPTSQETAEAAEGHREAHRELEDIERRHSPSGVVTPETTADAGAAPESDRKRRKKAV